MNAGRMVHYASQEAWRAITAARAFNPHEIHVSAMGACPRQVWYRARREPVSDRPEPVMMIAAHQGTGIDALYVDTFATTWASVDAGVDHCHPHHAVEWRQDGVTILGEADVVACGPGDTAQVWDLKTCEYGKFNTISAGNIPIGHVEQTCCYARMVERSTGRRVTTIHLYYLCRSDPEAHKDYRRSHRYFTASQDFDDHHRARADTLFDRATRAATSTLAPPRWFDAAQGKISSRYSPCAACPWQTRCLTGLPTR